MLLIDACVLISAYGVYAFFFMLISTSPAAWITTPLDQQNNAVDTLDDFFQIYLN